MFIIPAILAILNVILIAIYFYKDIVARKYAIAALDVQLEKAKEIKRKIAGDWYRATHPHKK